MPIYAYRCSSCGHAKDVLQKVSDPVLTSCPACGAEAFAKQVTAAGFQLKGSGWYVTDFRGNGQAEKKPADAKPAAEGGATTTPADGAKPAADGAKPSARSAEPAAQTPAAGKAASDKPAATPAAPPAAGS
jgi:putative FmdB family regulatory protein